MREDRDLTAPVAEAAAAVIAAISSGCAERRASPPVSSSCSTRRKMSPSRRSIECVACSTASMRTMKDSTTAELGDETPARSNFDIGDPFAVAPSAATRARFANSRALLAFVCVPRAAATASPQSFRHVSRARSQPSRASLLTAEDETAFSAASALARAAWSAFFSAAAPAAAAVAKAASAFCSARAADAAAIATALSALVRASAAAATAASPDACAAFAILDASAQAETALLASAAITSMRSRTSFSTRAPSEWTDSSSARTRSGRFSATICILSAMRALTFSTSSASAPSGAPRYARRVTRPVS